MNSFTFIYTCVIEVSSTKFHVMEVCYICEQETENFIHRIRWHDVNVSEKTILRPRQVAWEFHGYWTKGSDLITHEAKFPAEQCIEMLKKRCNEYNKLCTQFEESGCLNGNSLCRLSLLGTNSGSIHHGKEDYKPNTTNCANSMTNACFIIE